MKKSRETSTTNKVKRRVVFANIKIIGLDYGKRKSRGFSLKFPVKFSSRVFGNW